MNLVEEELEEFEKRYIDTIQNAHLNDFFIRQLIEHISKFKGKRIRPLLLFLSAKANGNGVEEIHYKLSIIIELMHQATLIHDDVLDDAIMRRKLQTVNTMWGNETSILLGDFIFAKLFQLITEIDSKEITRMLSTCALEMCIGELQQNATKFHFDISVEEYVSLIKRKTASLFSTTCKLGAIGGNSKSLYPSTLFEHIGLNLGVVFQVVDDYLDICGDEDSVGKSLGSDLEKGKLTLPLILLLENANTETRNEIKRIIYAYNISNKRQLIKKKLQENNINKENDKVVQYFLHKSREIINSIKERKFRDAFLDITEYIVTRDK